MQLRVTTRDEDGTSFPILIVQLDRPMLAVSSAPLGGGLGARNWVINATVDKSYSRLDPEAHLGDMAAAHGLDGPGVGFLTAVDVRDRKIATDAGVDAVVTVGLAVPTWASAPDEAPATRPGTINSVVRVPVRMSE